MLELPNVGELIGGMYAFGQNFFSGFLPWVWFFVAIPLVGIIIAKIINSVEDRAWDMNEWSYENDMVLWLKDRYGDEIGENYARDFISSRHMPDTRQYGLGYYSQAPTVSQPHFPSQNPYRKPENFYQAQNFSDDDIDEINALITMPDKPRKENKDFFVPGTGKIMTMREGRWVES